MNQIKTGLEVTVVLNSQTKPIHQGARLVFDTRDPDVIEHIYKFGNLPLTLSIQVDETRLAEIQSSISAKQRAKVMKTINELAQQAYGRDREQVRDELQRQFCEERGYNPEEFSLAENHCTSEQAGEFMEFVLWIALENGVELRDHPKLRVNDLTRWSEICLDKQICTIHTNEVGKVITYKGETGRRYQISLCQRCENELRRIHGKAFLAKYFVEGIPCKDQSEVE